MVYNVCFSACFYWISEWNIIELFRELAIFGESFLFDKRVQVVDEALYRHLSVHLIVSGTNIHRAGVLLAFTHNCNEGLTIVNSISKFNLFLRFFCGISTLLEWIIKISFSSNVYGFYFRIQKNHRNRSTYFKNEFENFSLQNTLSNIV